MNTVRERSPWKPLNSPYTEALLAEDCWLAESHLRVVVFSLRDSPHRQGGWRCRDIHRPGERRTWLQRTQHIGVYSHTAWAGHAHTASRTYRGTTKHTQGVRVEAQSRLSG
jgi:hypothetical protein